MSFFSLLLLWLIDPISQSVPADLISGLVFASVLVALVALYLYLNTKNLYLVLGTIVVGALVLTAFYFLDKGLYIGFIRKCLSWFSLNKRYENFSMGMLKVDSLVFYLSLHRLLPLSDGAGHRKTALN